MTWPHDTPIWHQLVYERGCPLGYDYTAFVPLWNKL